MLLLVKMCTETSRGIQITAPLYRLSISSAIFIRVTAERKRDVKKECLDNLKL